MKLFVAYLSDTMVINLLAFVMEYDRNFDSKAREVIAWLYSLKRLTLFRRS